MINDLFSKNQNHEIVIQVVSFQGWNSSNIPLLMTDLCYFPIGGFDTWSNHLCTEKNDYLVICTRRTSHDTYCVMKER